MTAKEIVAQLTLEEKASLCSGQDWWHTKNIDRLGLTNIKLSDGPHGLRKVESDDPLQRESIPSTCFPAACTTACSFDRNLLYELGQALGEECLQEQVSVILGPGTNIKRSPLCGRNFEYFSEDPFLAGSMAAAIIKGIQSKDVGTSLKHFAANSQESFRLTSNSVIDERALREIYLSAFEYAVKEAEPWTVMCSYNLLNGVQVSENKKLLTDILRDEWGFTGIVMSDWGAVNDRVKGVKAGLDLEMPSSAGWRDKHIVEAIRSGALDEKDLDTVVLRLVEFILKAQEKRKPDYKYDKDAHHALCRKVASESAVLLKNEHNLLPLKDGASLAVIGAFAKKPRYQGAGSSKINPTRLDTLFDVLTAAGIKFDYAEGYALAPDAGVDWNVIDEAEQVAAGKDAVIIVAGLPDEYESEGYDRKNMNMPENQNLLIDALARVNPNIVVLLQLGSPAALPWKDTVPAILSLYLGGQAGAGAAVDLLTGKVNPSGKLGETWPVSLADTPCNRYYPGDKTAEYRESIFVGYRYYDTAEKEVVFPFGHGLSYTTFAYSNLKVSASSFKPGEKLTLTFTVKNTGTAAGAEAVQVYVAPRKTFFFRAEQELKAFEKIALKPGQEQTVTVELDTRSFAYYNTIKSDWAVESALYEIRVGASSRDVRLTATVDVTGDSSEKLFPDLPSYTPEYYNLKQSAAFAIRGATFRKLRERTAPFSLNSTIGEAFATPVGQKLIPVAAKQIGALLGKPDSDIISMLERGGTEMPLRSLLMWSIPLPHIESFIAALNSGTIDKI